MSSMTFTSDYLVSSACKLGSENVEIPNFGQETLSWACCNLVTWNSIRTYGREIYKSHVVLVASVRLEDYHMCGTFIYSWSWGEILGELTDWLCQVGHLIVSRVVLVPRANSTAQHDELAVLASHLQTCIEFVRAPLCRECSAYCLPRIFWQSSQGTLRIGKKNPEHLPCMMQRS